MADPADGKLVELSESLLLVSEFVAQLRHDDSGQRGLTPGNGYDGDEADALLKDQIGCYGEVAFAKYINLFWDASVGANAQVGDVGGYQVKATPRLSGDLIIQDHHRTDRPYVQVVGRPPLFRVAGWIWGQAARNRDWWKTKNHRPKAFWVPQSALEPMETLPVWDLDVEFAEWKKRMKR